MILQEGMMVKYIARNEIGLISEVKTERHPGAPTAITCWWHTGGTRSVVDPELIEVLTMSDILLTTFENEYAKASLIERQLRLLEEDGLTDDLIDDRDIRPFVKDLLTGVKGIS